MRDISPLLQVDNDSYYFRGYAHWGVHETMLTDTVRTGGYERAICDNAAFFKDKVRGACVPSGGAAAAAAAVVFRLPPRRVNQSIDVGVGGVVSYSIRARIHSGATEGVATLQPSPTHKNTTTSLHGHVHFALQTQRPARYTREAQTTGAAVHSCVALTFVSLPSFSSALPLSPIRRWCSMWGVARGC